MNYLSVENLSKNYGEKVLFQDLTFGLSKGDRVALIAENGAGKTSLLKILADLDIGDNGKVTFRSNIRVGLLEQDPQFDPNLTISELIEISNSRLKTIISEYEAALEKQESSFSPDNQKILDEAAAKMELNQAWDYHRELKQILNKFEIRNLDQNVGTLSGGQIKRLALALVLIDKPDILLLDEPTNHLDIQMIEWLEEFLVQSATTLLMVTHDRYFLDAVCGVILELSHGKLYKHNGNYAYYLLKKSERETIQDTEIDKARKRLKQEMEWMRRMPKARTTKSKARIDSVYELKDKASQKRVKEELKLDVKMSRIGGKILEFKNVSKGYGDIKILEHFNYLFKKGEHIGIIGKNGVGKSTFLNLIKGTDHQDSGKIIQGETIKIGYFSQSGIQLDNDKRVIEVLKEKAEVIEMSNGSRLTASQLLQHFMFSPKMQHSYVSTLSGGERKRLYLLTVLMRNPNFLILDEPTNDLDLMTLNRLEEFLMNFKGCLVLVSHDRYFLDRLCDHLFIFEGDARIKDYYGTYTEYHLAKEQEKKTLKEQQKKVKTQKATEPQVSKEKTKLTYGERLELEKLEKDIAGLEEAKKGLEQKVELFADQYEELQKVLSELADLQNQLDTKTDRWLVLSEFDH